ncbi:hypothetical protein DY000_02031088 [Brassica cretica]|uniref:Uncharacterized protein n=1 Tax=Brassica cretica TaxID=69181 RepID=A0ABQ7DTJ3_BRACR|nr:hypothetical protein DY000_02031088 [Brassica cretica]
MQETKEKKEVVHERTREKRKRETLTARVFKSLWNSAGLRSIPTTILPHICAQLRWYYILVIGVYASVVAFGNDYGAGDHLRSDSDSDSDSGSEAGSGHPIKLPCNVDTQQRFQVWGSLLIPGDRVAPWRIRGP